MVSPPHRDFLFPLNVFVHILIAEEGRAEHLHYGLFECEDESIGVAQARSTALLFERLPPPPARILDVGVGLGSSIGRLRELGYDVLGITPDERQVEAVRASLGKDAPVRCVRFEDLGEVLPFDTVVFQESSQYIDSQALFATCARVTRHVVVLDEFALAPLDDAGALHTLKDFLAAAVGHDFERTEDVDLSAKAAPTPAYFLSRVENHRDALIRDLGVDCAQLDALIASGRKYCARYREGVYGYRLMQFRRQPAGKRLRRYLSLSGWRQGS